MVKKCVICGKNVTKYVTNPDHPQKYICLQCMGRIVFSNRSVDIELGPIREAFGKAFEAFKEEWGKQQKEE
jgi:DNA-directed RNA polymerase subunit RPC12/RpoP